MIWIWKTLKKSGGPSRSQTKIIRPPLEVIDSLRLFHPQTWRNKSFLHQKYVLEGFSIRQIAELVVSSKEAVKTEILKQGIPLRKKSQHHGRPAQTKFGQRVADSVKPMKTEGLSLRAIARCLDLMKIPTKMRGKKWHPEMVKRILDDDQKWKISSSDPTCNCPTELTPGITERLTRSARCPI